MGSDRTRTIAAGAVPGNGRRWAIAGSVPIPCATFALKVFFPFMQGFAFPVCSGMVVRADRGFGKPNNGMNRR
jgi:hypothetical protein